MENITFRASKRLRYAIQKAAKLDHRNVSDWVRLQLEKLLPPDPKNPFEGEDTDAGE